MEGILSKVQLSEHIKRVFGSDYLIDRISTVHGGAQKMVRCIDCTNGFRFVLYVWDIKHNYFQEEIDNGDTDAPSFGGSQFAANLRLLHELGVRTPELYDFNRPDCSGMEFAMVEWITGREASDYFHSDSRTQDRIFIPLSHMVEKMHSHLRENHGKEHLAPLGDIPCETKIRGNAKHQLAYLNTHYRAVAENYDRLLEVIDSLYSRIEARTRHGFIHGELGPNHVLINERLEPCLIDLDGAMFYDIEHEHSFMEFRFDNYVRYFRNDDLDPHRMRLYKLNHHISYAASGTKLLYRGYPDRKQVQDIVDFNLRSALEYLFQEDQR